MATLLALLFALVLLAAVCAGLAWAVSAICTFVAAFLPAEPEQPQP